MTKRRVLNVYLLEFLGRAVHRFFRSNDYEFVDIRKLPIGVTNIFDWNRLYGGFNKTRLRELAGFRGWFLWVNCQCLPATVRILNSLADRNLLPERLVILLLDASRFFKYDCVPDLVSVARFATKIYVCDEDAELRARALGADNVVFNWHVGYEWWYTPILCEPVYDACMIATTYNQGCHGEIGNQNGCRGLGRVQLVRALLDAEIKNLYVAGSPEWRKLDPRFTDLPMRNHVERYQLCNLRSAESRIVLAYDVADCRKFMSVRTPNAMLGANMVITHYKPGFEELFENHVSIAWFTEIDEAVEMVRYYSPRHWERYKIERAGFELAQRHLRYESLAKRIARDLTT